MAENVRFLDRPGKQITNGGRSLIGEINATHSQGIQPAPLPFDKLRASSDPGYRAETEVGARMASRIP